MRADVQLAIPSLLMFPHNMQGALGVNTSLFAFSFVCFNFLSNATTPLVAGALSSGNKQQVRLFFDC